MSLEQIASGGKRQAYHRGCWRSPKEFKSPKSPFPPFSPCDEHIPAFREKTVIFGNFKNLKLITGFKST